MIQTEIDWVAPQDPRVGSEDAARLSAQALKILELLRQGPQTNVFLARDVSHRFGGRLHDLRALGYEWSAWAELDVEHVARYGKDFDCTQASFVSLLHRRADRQGLIVETHTDGIDVKFTFRRRAKRRMAK